MIYRCSETTMDSTISTHLSRLHPQGGAEKIPRIHPGERRVPAPINLLFKFVNVSTNLKFARSKNLALFSQVLYLRDPFLK